MRTAVLVLSGVIAAVPAAWGQAGRWRPDERVVLANFSQVQAIAVSRSSMYAATTEGLIVMDRRFNHWDAPVTRLDGFPDARVTSAIIDPADESVWFASEAGLIHYQPQLHQVETALTGPVIDLMFDRDNPVGGIYLRTERSGWEMLPRGALMSSPTRDLPPVTRRLQPLSLSSALQRFPAAEALGPTSLLDRRLRQARYTSAAMAAGENEVFFGTDGLGVVRFDALASRLEPIAFGLRSSAVGSLLAIPGGGGILGPPGAVWVGTNASPGSPAGFARVSDDFQGVRYEEGGAAAPSFQRSSDLFARGQTLWAGTEHGILRFEPGSPWRPLDVAQGDPVLALAQTPTEIWIGTNRGLVFATEAGAITRVGNATSPVLALLAMRDSVVVGTANGLRFVPAASPDLVVPADVAAEPALSSAIVAITRNIDTLVVATPERIAWKAPRGPWVVERVLTELGGLRALAPERAGVWIGGERGIAYFRFIGHSFTTFTSPEDLPGPVTKLANVGPYLWVGTERGLVRFAKRALLP
jgi:hypothetical protein